MSVGVSAHDDSIAINQVNFYRRIDEVSLEYAQSESDDINGLTDYINKLGRLVAEINESCKHASEQSRTKLIEFCNHLFQQNIMLLLECELTAAVDLSEAIAELLDQPYTDRLIRHRISDFKEYLQHQSEWRQLIIESDVQFRQAYAKYCRHCADADEKQ